MFVAYIIGWVILNQTKFGAHVYALGGNPAAAALNGIYVVTLLLFIRFIFIAPYFFSSRNLVNILISASLAGIVTAGYTVAILAGQIETSTQGVLAVATVTTALLSVRVLTPVMFAASWVAARSAGLGLPLAVNRLARSSRTYRIPLLLLILTLALAVFTASLAQTMKRQLAEELLYRFGADMSLTELGETIEIDPLGTSSNSTESANSDTDQQQSASAARLYFMVIPAVAQHRSAAGVQAVTRVGQYKALAHVARWKAEGRFFGIDRVDLPSVGFWRRDFAPRSLGELMNVLAITPNGVLVPSGFLRQMSLCPGRPAPCYHLHSRTTQGTLMARRTHRIRDCRRLQPVSRLATA